MEALRDDISQEALTASLQGLVAGLADTLGALSMEFDDDDDDDDDDYEDIVDENENENENENE